MSGLPTRVNIRLTGGTVIELDVTGVADYDAFTSIAERAAAGRGGEATINARNGTSTFRYEDVERVEFLHGVYWLDGTEVTR